MQDKNSLSHAKWKCTFHIVWIPKYGRKKLYRKSRGYLNKEIKSFMCRCGCDVFEGYIMPDRIHMLISISPKVSISRVMGYIKGKRAIYIARQFRGKIRIFSGENF